MNGAKEKWGLVMVPKPSVDSEDLIRPISFKAHIGRYEKGMNKDGVQFVTNPALEDLVKQSPLLKEYETGEMRFLVFPKDKFLQITRVYPFERLPARLQHEIQHKGVASFLEYRTLLFLQKRFSDFSVSTQTPLELRRGQMKKRGQNPYQAVPIAQVIRQIRAYLVKGMREYHGIEPRPRRTYGERRWNRKVRARKERMIEKQQRRTSRQGRK
ncbi:MAG: hypothetical protein Q7R47_00880 [Candidatus Diapherotrites archaeon]|nr:hypothetical protein [Candidatus Diapherotrites archaeon]